MFNNLRQIPVGIDDFREVIERNNYFVDKTLLIKKIIENASKVILFTRPRRFGKTLNFSMLKCFLEIPECRKLENEDRDYKYLFKGLDIYQEKDLVDNYLGKYPVINLSFKKIKASNWEDANYLFKEEISREYNRHSYLLDKNVVTPAGNRRKFERIMNMEGRSIEYTAAIADLSKFLEIYYENEVIVLIDEYDTPLHYAKLNGYYKEMLDIMRALMVDGVKSNKSLEKAIVTGIMKISQESIFSSFNNPKISSLTDSFCEKQFGFTEKEVWEMLEYYNLDEFQGLVQEWYNGYLFGGDTVIYNPWSVLSFIDNEDHLPQTYWSNTGDTGLIKRCLKLDELTSKNYIERLLQGETLEKKVEHNIIYEDVFNNIDKALSYLLHAGYLKARRKSREENKYLLSIPNREIQEIYKNILENWFSREQKISGLIQDLLNDLFSMEIDKFSDDLGSILLTLSSYYDTAFASSQIKTTRKKKETERYENFYHGLMLGIMINVMERYIVESNQEYGKGRPDLVILPKNKNERAYILEFKNVYTSSQKTAKEAAREALQQISEKRYEEGVNKTGVKSIVKIGLGFKGKETAVEWEL